MASNTLLNTYRICTRCIMDTSATDINFNQKGECNYCTSYLERFETKIIRDPIIREKELNKIISKIKVDGKSKAYDCVVGVSGGADSSWMLVQAVRYGLRPLAVHMDNGWNSALAQSNISNIVKKLNVDLYTHVIDWEEYKLMMQSFFNADVLDVELLYDNAMLAVNYRLASKFKIQYILSGSNQTTEGIYTPKGWNWYKLDKRNIKSIIKKNGNIRTKSFPYFSTFDYIIYRYLKNIKWCSLLDLMDYNKEKAMNFMSENYGYLIYSHKHYESIFTRFYQGYILQEKFKVDKRRLHLSALIASGQVTRDDAISRCDGIAYDDSQVLEHDKRYFLKKMNWREQDLIDYINRPAVPHDHYKSEKHLRDSLFSFAKKVVELRKSK